MPNPSKGLTFNTRLRLTDQERAMVDDLAAYGRPADDPLSFNEAVRMAIRDGWDYLPEGARSTLPYTAPEGQTTIEVENDQ